MAFVNLAAGFNKGFTGEVTGSWSPVAKPPPGIEARSAVMAYALRRYSSSS